MSVALPNLACACGHRARQHLRLELVDHMYFESGRCLAVGCDCPGLREADPAELVPLTKEDA